MMAARRIAGIALVGAVSMTSAGCATNGLASLPLPHPGLIQGGYALTAVFENALNVPALAKVRLAGADAVAWGNGERYLKIAKDCNRIKVVGPLKRDVFDLVHNASLRHIQVCSRKPRVWAVVQKGEQ